MRRPEIASARRNRVRLRRKKNPGMARPQGRKPPRRPLAKLAPPAANAPQASIAGVAATSSFEEAAAREPLRCCFGAVRVGAFLGRLRLHLQTDRFLAVHRGDAVWEEGCLGAAFALADVVAGMPEPELGALLTSQHAQAGRALGTPAAESPGLSPPEPAEGSAVAVHPRRTADSSSSAKSGLPGMTIPGGYAKTSSTTAARCGR